MTVTRNSMIHPALLMVGVWVACALLYAALPFHLVDKALTIEGALVMVLFLISFCAGALVIAPIGPLRSQLSAQQRVDFSRTDAWLAAACTVSIAAFLLDLRDKSVLDLAVAYELRSDTASALMDGESSSSGLAFQIGFLTYPAAYVYAVRMVVFKHRIPILRTVLFGVLPVLLATIVMGGRSPLLYGIVIAMLAIGHRTIYQRGIGQLRRKTRNAEVDIRKILGVSAVAVVAVGAMSYFIAVFLVRAELSGGGAGMFMVAEEVWGIGFRGSLADAMFYALGQEWTYIVFVFNWYVVQGLLMANFIFSDYQGPMQLGVYGIDLVSALVRRFDGPLIAGYFDSLQRIGIYGFYPSAWGSLYVDLWLFGVAASAIWGAFAAKAYRSVKLGRDSRWLLVAPFVTMGIAFSFINTPFGFANGLVAHLWLLVAFLAARQRAPICNETHARARSPHDEPWIQSPALNA